MMRTNMSFAVVCMVSETNVDTESMVDRCGRNITPVGNNSVSSGEEGR